MRYGNYEEYGRRMRDSRGRYMEGGYGRRGVPGSGRGRRYREGGDEAMEEMMENYGEYSEGRDNYGADGETIESLEKMLESLKKFMHHIKKNAKSPEEMQLIEETAREISEMM